MPRRAHRRCKEQGPTCNGVTHPGFDICARCLHDVVRKRQREEREAVKSRRAMRSMHNKLSKENRELINQVDLQEPHLQPEEPNWLVPPIEDKPPKSLRRILVEGQIDKNLADVPDEKIVEVLGGQLVQDMLADIPPDIRPTVPARYRPKVTEPLEEEPMPPPVVQPPAPGHTRRHGKLTEEQEDEVVEMFKSGISTSEIQVAYAIGAQTLYTLIRRRGVPLRGRGPRAVHLPEEQPVSQSVTPPASAPEVTVPTPNGVVSDLPQWVVTYEVVRTETVTVSARDFNDAAQAARSYAAEDVTVVGVVRKR